METEAQDTIETLQEAGMNDNDTQVSTALLLAFAIGFVLAVVVGMALQ